MGSDAVRLDTTIVDLHRLSSGPVAVEMVEGGAWKVTRSGERMETIVGGARLDVGDTVFLAAGARIFASGIELRGGRHGRAHAFVGPDAFLPSPSRKDVPRLLEQLAQVEATMSGLGTDPLAIQPGPGTEFERATSSEFARRNLVLSEARQLPEALARRLEAVCLFFSAEAAFVAASEMSIGKLRSLMQALGRPINPQLVEPKVVQEMLETVYGPDRPS